MSVHTDRFAISGRRDQAVIIARCPGFRAKNAVQNVWHISCIPLREEETQGLPVRILQQILVYNFGSTAMLGYALTFMIIALIAGAMGFGLVGGMAYGAAKICFFVFLVLAVLSLVRGRSISV